MPGILIYPGDIEMPFFVDTNQAPCFGFVGSNPQQRDIARQVAVDQWTARELGADTAVIVDASTPESMARVQADIDRRILQYREEENRGHIIVDVGYLGNDTPLHDDIESLVQNINRYGSWFGVRLMWNSDTLVSSAVLPLLRQMSSIVWTPDIPDRQRVHSYHLRCGQSGYQPTTISPWHLLHQNAASVRLSDDIVYYDMCLMFDPRGQDKS